MTRDHAARILGVPPTAPKSAVTAAFRRRARALHPDAAGSNESSAAPANMAALVAARDLLLTPAPPPGSQSMPSSWQQPAAGNPQFFEPEPSSGSRWLSGLVAVASFGFLAVLAVVVLVTVFGGGIFGDREPADPSPATAEQPASADSTDGTDEFSGCVLLFQTSENSRRFEEADCSTANTWEISSWTEGLAACPADEEAIRNADGTWCLIPPDLR